MAVPNDGDDTTTENESYAKSSDSLIYLVKDGKDSFISWVVCACGFIARALIIGVLHGFGSFFVEFVKEFNISKECSGKVLEHFIKNVFFYASYIISVSLEINQLDIFH